MSDDHVLVNRVNWDADAPNWVERGRAAWAREEPVWGRGNPESELHLLNESRGAGRGRAWLRHRLYLCLDDAPGRAGRRARQRVAAACHGSRVPGGVRPSVPACAR